MRAAHGFTLVESLVVIGALAVGGSLAATGLKLNGSSAKAMSNSTQLRGIHQGFVVYAQSNKKGGGDGWFPGLDAEGNVADASTEERFRIMLDGLFFTGDYIISPLENLTPWEWGDGDEGAPLFAQQYSYAMLKVDDLEADEGRHSEWKETFSASAVVLSDRNTAAPEQTASVWTDGQEEPDAWVGAMTRNDNSTSFKTSPLVEKTKYGKHPTNETDNLFISETPKGSDALMTFTRDALGGEVATPRRNAAKPPALPGDGPF